MYHKTAFILRGRAPHFTVSVNSSGIAPYLLFPELPFEMKAQLSLARGVALRYRQEMCLLLLACITWR